MFNMAQANIQKPIPVQQISQVAKTPVQGVQPAIVKGGKSKWWLWAIVVVISLGVGLLAGYFIFSP